MDSRQIDAFFWERLGEYFEDNWADEPYQRLIDYGTAQRESWDSFKAVAQSPIELRLGAYILFMTDGYNRILYEDINPGLQFVTRLFPQHKFGRYKVDFCFRVEVEGRIRHVVVECDGHEYHERTKEQAQKDRSRDRWFQANDIKILRFTGSEIYRDAAKCCEEIQGVLGDEVERLLVEAGHIQGKAA